MRRSSRVLPTKLRKAGRLWCSRKKNMGCAGVKLPEHEANFIPFSAYTRMSGVDIDGRMLRKGASDAIANFVKELGGTVPAGLSKRRPTASHARAALRWRWQTGRARSASFI